MFTHIAIATPTVDLAALRKQPGWQNIQNLQEMSTEEATILIWRTPDQMFSADLVALATGEVFHVAGNLDGKTRNPHVSS